MRFVRKVISSQVFVYVDMEGLELNTGLSKEQEEQLKHFKASSYKVLTSGVSSVNGQRVAGQEEANWNTVFGVVHLFLDTFSDQELIKFGTLLIWMHSRILDVMATSQDQQPDGNVVTNLEQELSKALAQFCIDFHISERLVAFTEKTVKIQVMNNAGERPKDSHEMTFYRPQVVQVAGLAILCKMLAPIFMTYLEFCDTGMLKDYKDLHCYSILKDTFEREFPEITDKLDYYITHTVEEALKHTPSLSNLYRGFTPMVTIRQIEAQIIVRRFVSVNMFDREKNNLMTYVNSCAKSAAGQQFGNSNKISVKELSTDFKDKSDGDEGNLSILECESQLSTHTLDMNLMVSRAIAQTRYKFLTEYEINEEQLESAEAFYKTHPVDLGTLNSLVLGSLFGNYICGAKSIELVNAVDLATLTSIAQLYLVAQGFGDLAIALTLRSAGTMKTEFTDVDNAIRATWKNNFEYQNCADKFVCRVGEVTWDTSLKKIVDELTTEVKLYEVAPVIWDLVNSPNQNTNVYTPPSDLMRTVCRFLRFVFQ